MGWIVQVGYNFFLAVLKFYAFFLPFVFFWSSRGRAGRSRGFVFDDTLQCIFENTADTCRCTRSTDYSSDRLCPISWSCSKMRMAWLETVLGTQSLNCSSMYYPSQVPLTQH